MNAPPPASASTLGGRLGRDAKFFLQDLSVQGILSHLLDDRVGATHQRAIALSGVELVDTLLTLGDSNMVHPRHTPYDGVVGVRGAELEGDTHNQVGKGLSAITQLLEIGGGRGVSAEVGYPPWGNPRCGTSRLVSREVGGGG